MQPGVDKDRRDGRTPKDIGVAERLYVIERRLGKNSTATGEMSEIPPAREVPEARKWKQKRVGVYFPEHSAPERYYESSHNQNEFDHISIYVHISYLELQLGIQKDREEGMILDETDISERLFVIEDSLGVRPATRRPTSKNALERLNHLETAIAGLTVEQLVADFR